MLKNNIGLVEAYNNFHNTDECSPEVTQFRALHVRIDLKVIESYGWHDIDLNHGFYETPRDGIRFTISEGARHEILERLLKLNHERYEDEIECGLHEKSKTKKIINAAKKKKNSLKSLNQDLFGFKFSDALIQNGTDQAILTYLSNNDGWHTEADTLSRSGILAKQWQSTINQLLADGLVERQGERRGARYRAVKTGSK